MSANIKVLQEKRGAKVKELDAIIKAARAENRSLSSDEGSKYDGLEKEVNGFDVEIEREVRHAATLSKQAVKLSEGEERDVNRFDLAVALRALAKGKNLEGAEAEICAEGEREAAASGIESRGLMLPRMFVRRTDQRAISATGTTSVTGDQGGMTIQTDKKGLLDDFYNLSILAAMGATVMEGCVGNLDLPRLIAGTAPAKKTENATADSVSPTTAMLSLLAKRLPASMLIGEQLLKQSSSAIESIVRKSLTSQMAAVQETAFFHGGGTNEANGIAGTSGIGSVAGGTNGANPTWANIVALESKVDAQNALLGTLKYMTNGAVRAQLKTTIKNPNGTDSTYIIDDRSAGIVNGYGYGITNAISRTLTKGSSSVASAIFFGNVSDYVIAYWGGLQLELIRDSVNATNGQYTLVGAVYYDGGVWRPKSFSAMLDALTPNA